jgi:hypothetical protein
MDTPPTSGPAAPAPSGARFAARRDLLLVVLLTSATAVVSARLNLSEVVLSWARPRERLQLDELPGLLLVLAICLIWFSLRRYAKTVANLQTSIEQKLGASPALQLIVMARQLGVE